MDKLTFAALREANLARLPLFKNRNGEPAHTEPDGSDWTPNDWMTALAGEVGEAANILKKVRRGDSTMDESREALAKELADAVIYLDLLAFRCGIHLSGAVMDKWNEVSARIGVDVRLTPVGPVDIGSGL